MAGAVSPFGAGLPIAVALVAAASVATGLRLPVAAAVTVALVGGAAVGLDARPQGAALPAVLLAGAATALSGSVLVSMVAALVLSRARFWQEVAVRVAGSWITASGMLYLSWRLVGQSG